MEKIMMPNEINDILNNNGEGKWMINVISDDCNDSSYHQYFKEFEFKNYANAIKYLLDTMVSTDYEFYHFRLLIKESKKGAKWKIVNNFEFERPSFYGYHEFFSSYKNIDDLLNDLNDFVDLNKSNNVYNYEEDIKNWLKINYKNL